MEEKICKMIGKDINFTEVIVQCECYSEKRPAEYIFKNSRDIADIPDCPVLKDRIPVIKMKGIGECVGVRNYRQQYDDKYMRNAPFVEI